MTRRGRCDGRASAAARPHDAAPRLEASLRAVLRARFLASGAATRDASHLRADLPTGTVTFVFTDVEGSTRLLHELGAAGYADELAAHRRVIRGAASRHGGVEVDTQGDAFFLAFPTAPGALAAVEEIVAGLAPGRIRARIGVHTGTPLVVEEGYVGTDLHRAARIASAGHGGQVLVSGSTAALVDGPRLLDLGEHRFKDLAAPERVFQLGARSFPPLRSLHRTNLPVPATPFQGRERELGELAVILEDASARLVTLTGPGGTGKTRLALQAAAHAAEGFRDGVWWVPLAALDDDGLVVPAVARALDVVEEDGRSLEACLADAVGSREMLLVTDNCEHLPEGVAASLAPLLAACPRLRVLATSRASLGLAGERVVAVPPLERADAIDLFVTRARAAGSALELDTSTRDSVESLCRRLDDLPLAIEVAAARVAALPVTALLARLERRLDLSGPRDADARQRTLRATIAWSHDLLDADEQRLFRRLAAFTGGCTIDACEGVCESELDVLLSLVDKSLVRRRDDPSSEPRYWMLETIRHFALDALDASGERERTLDRHASWFGRVACEALATRRGGDSSSLQRLEPDTGNLRAALTWSLPHAGTDRSPVASLAAVLAERAASHGLFAEAEQAVDTAIAHATDAVERALALNLRAHILLWSNRPEDARQAHEEAERALGEPPADGDDDGRWWRAWLAVELSRSWHHYWLGETEELDGRAARLAGPLERHGTAAHHASALHVRVGARYRRERYALSEETERLAREAYDRAREIGARDSDFMLGFCLLWRGALDESETHLHAGLARARDAGDEKLVVQCLSYLATLERLRGDVESCAAFVEELAALDERPQYEGAYHANRAWLALRRDDPSAVEHEAREALDTWQQSGKAGPVVFQWTARFPLLAVAVGRGELPAAAEQAHAMLDERQQPLPGPIAEALRVALAAGTPAAWAEAVARGRDGGYA